MIAQRHGPTRSIHSWKRILPAGGNKIDTGRGMSPELRAPSGEARDRRPVDVGSGVEAQAAIIAATEKLSKFGPPGKAVRMR